MDGARTVESGTTHVYAEVRAGLGEIVLNRPDGMSKPVVAALPGEAAGPGLALSADLRVGSPRTVMVSAFAPVGLFGGFGTAWLLHQLLGPALARRVLYLSGRLDARECLELWLLDRIVPPSELTDRARQIVGRLANDPRRAPHMKDDLAHAGTDTLAAAMDREVPRHLECGNTADHRAAVQGFVEKPACLRNSREPS